MNIEIYGILVVMTAMIIALSYCIRHAYRGIDYLSSRVTRLEGEIDRMEEASQGMTGVTGYDEYLP